MTPSNRTTDNSRGDNTVQETKWTTNAKWVVGILALLVILLLSWLLSNYIAQGDNLIHAIENFSTILSIVLSVSSIAFAGYTSIETGRQYHSMSKAVTEIETSNKIMSSNYRDLLKHYHDTVNQFSKQMGATNHISNQEMPVNGIIGNTKPNSTIPSIQNKVTEVPSTESPTPTTEQPTENE